MSNTLQTLQQLIVLNDRNANDYGITDLLLEAPLLAALNATLSSNGTQHKYLKQTSAPTVGFRAINAGINQAAGKDTLVTIDLKYLDASHQVDIALTQGYEKGEAAYLERELARNLRKAFFYAEQQLIYGTGNDADGFTGMAQSSTLSVNTSDQVVDAGAASSATDLTSVYLIRTLPDDTAVSAVIGNGGVIDVKDPTIQAVTDGDGKTLNVWNTPVGGYLGLQVGSKYDIVRIANLSDATQSAGVPTYGLTDKLLSKVLERCPSQPTFIVMNRRSRGQLQRSRTTFSPTGAYAPMPTEFEGIPIIKLESISNAETYVGA